jgi:asparagine N-glycosylation enzyme membrane subunit Stt3
MGKKLLFELKKRSILNQNNKLMSILIQIKSVKTGYISWAVLTAISYFYMVSAWGGILLKFKYLMKNILFNSTFIFY